MSRITLIKIKLFISLAVAKLLGFKFVWVKANQDKKAVMRLRYKVYSDEGHIDDIASKELKDKYDLKSDNLLVTFRGENIATVRVVYDSAVGFPTENMFNINLPGSRSEIVEISRLCILRDFRSKKFYFRARIVVGAMAEKLYLFSKKKDIKIWLFNMAKGLKKSFAEKGVPIYDMPEGEPESKHLKERKIIEKYFQKTEIRPYYIKVDRL